MGSKCSHLRPEELDDLLRSTAFSAKEIHMWYKGFHKDCPTGRLNLHEFKNMYKTFFPNGDSDSFSEHVFRAFDVNKDDTIDFHEFLCALSVASKGTETEKLQWAFRMYDIDHDGSITRDEMLQIVTVGGSHAHSFAKGVLSVVLLSLSELFASGLRTATPGDTSVRLFAVCPVSLCII